MGKIKEVFIEHQQQEDLIETYYNELFKVGYTIGVEESEIKEIINQTKRKCQKRKHKKL